MPTFKYDVLLYEGLTEGGIFPTVLQSDFGPRTGELRPSKVTLKTGASEAALILDFRTIAFGGISTLEITASNIDKFKIGNSTVGNSFVNSQDFRLVSVKNGDEDTLVLTITDHFAPPFFSIPAEFDTDKVFYLVLSGPPLPEFADLDSFNEFWNRETVEGVTSGEISPGEIIPISRLLDAAERQRLPANEIEGSKENDILQGGSEDDLILGLDGDDNLTGAGGDDILRGDVGNDTLDGGGGKDFLNGDAGNDFLNGRRGNDTLEGASGSDVLSGGGGRDILEAGSGRDVLNGGGGKDQLSGGNGKDVLSGDGGADLLIGGAGADRFLFSKTSGFDTIADFRVNRDKVVIDGMNLDFGDLNIRNSREDVIVQSAGFRLKIQDLEPADLSATDFVFT